MTIHELLLAILVHYKLKTMYFFIHQYLTTDSYNQ